MQIDPNTRPAATTMRALPFHPTDASTSVPIDAAVRSTLIRWAGSAQGDIHPSRVQPRTAKTIFATESVPWHPDNPYVQTVRHYLHEWSTDPSRLFDAARAVRIPGVPARPDTITSAQLTALFTSFDANADGVLQAGAELDALRSRVGETWTWTGNSVEAM